MSFTENATDFIVTDDFADSATLEGVAVSVILDNSFVGMADSPQPVAVGSYAALGAASRGETLIVDSVSYTVSEIHNDFAKVVTTLVLKIA
tara:strand:- start:1620 stop:1892 length:273 start_codon:yes stop_codon:yes gene_type:complete